ncbi:MAG: hypothetical protein ACREVS_00615 [Burkholderiales bacterium]
MRFIERLVIAAVLAFAVVSGAPTADPAAPGLAGPQVEAPVAPR